MTVSAISPTDLKTFGFGTLLNDINVSNCTKLYTPTGTSADSANLIALATTMAGVGEVSIGPGTFIIPAGGKINLTGLSDLIISCHPNTVFQSSLVYSDGLTQSAFYSANSMLSAAVDLQASVTRGAKSIVVTDVNAAILGVVNGSEIIINQNAASTAARHTVTGTPTSFGGNTTITLDRPTPLAWPHVGPAKAQVGRINSSSRVHLYGNGAQICGMGDRAIQMMVSKDCTIDDWRIVSDKPVAEGGSGGFGGFGVSFDIGGLRNVMSRVKVFANHACIMGCALESNEGSVVQDCYVRDVQNNLWGAGVYVFSGRGVTIRGGEFHNNPIGVQIEFFGGAAQYQPGGGTQVDGVYCHHNTIGLKVGEGSRDTHVRAGVIQDNTETGIEIANGIMGGIVTGTVIDGTTISNNGITGLLLGAGVIQTRASSLTMDSNGLGINAASDLQVNGLLLNGNTKHMLVTGCKVFVSGLKSTAGVTAPLIAVFGGGVLDINQIDSVENVVNAAVGAAGMVLYNDSSTLRVANGIIGATAVGAGVPDGYLIRDDLATARTELTNLTLSRVLGNGAIYLHAGGTAVCRNVRTPTGIAGSQAAYGVYSGGSGVTATGLYDTACDFVSANGYTDDALGTHTVGAI